MVGGMTSRWRMRILTPDGIEFVEVSDPVERSLVGQFWNGVRKYLRTGDDSGLWGLDGETVAGRPLDTSLDAIDYWGHRGELDFEDIYE
jgi:hypothetical protein